jgi:hypothetical protein
MNEIVRTIGVPAENQKEHLSDVYLEICRQTDLFYIPDAA